MRYWFDGIDEDWGREAKHRRDSGLKPRPHMEVKDLLLTSVLVAGQVVLFLVLTIAMLERVF